MRLPTPRRSPLSLLSLSLIPLLLLAAPSLADDATDPPTNSGTGTGAAAGGLYPPGLQPLITRANVLLSTGQFSEAARVYSEAIGGFCFLSCVLWTSLSRFPARRRGRRWRREGRTSLRTGRRRVSVFAQCCIGAEEGRRSRRAFLRWCGLAYTSFFPLGEESGPRSLFALLVGRRSSRLWRGRRATPVGGRSSDFDWRFFRLRRVVGEAHTLLRVPVRAHRRCELRSYRIPGVASRHSRSIYDWCLLVTAIHSIRTGVVLGPRSHHLRLDIGRTRTTATQALVAHYFRLCSGVGRGSHYTIEGGYWVYLCLLWCA
ncbi:hypothetical protein B0H16DRAFT_1768659 [Mycena metata]|uniref:Uncharacterized protein n=1 Tax=Mycena metata TaxID=1033252 RepID=A0AAD7I214_9AGAR|nr:hypothetical protein B0H16DRAFT_1768659 [Mycena metata]